MLIALIQRNKMTDGSSQGEMKKNENPPLVWKEKDDVSTKVVLENTITGVYSASAMQCLESDDEHFLFAIWQDAYSDEGEKLFDLYGHKSRVASIISSIKRSKGFSVPHSRIAKIDYLYRLEEKVDTTAQEPKADEKTDHENHDAENEPEKKTLEKVTIHYENGRSVEFKKLSTPFSLIIQYLF